MEKRKIYKTGKKTYVVSMPQEWALKIIKPYGPEVFLSWYHDKILIVPVKERQLLRAEIDVNPNDLEGLEASVISAYLSGCEELHIKMTADETECIERLSKLRKKLYGAFMTRTPDEFVFEFSASLKPIREILDTTYSLFNSMCSRNIELMKERLPLDSEILDQKASSINSMEDAVDQYSYLIKRFLNKALRDPEVLPRISVESEDIIEYHTIASSIERLTDLQKEIFEGIKELSERCEANGEPLDLSSCPEKCSLEKYLKNATLMVEKAYRGSKDEKKDVLKTKRFSRFRPGFIEREERDEILEFVRKGKYSDILIPLEGKVWALTGISTNVAEAWMNMYRP